mgnify:FL=1
MSGDGENDLKCIDAAEGVTIKGIVFTERASQLIRLPSGGRLEITKMS